VLLATFPLYAEVKEDFEVSRDVQRESAEQENLTCALVEEPGKAENHVFKMEWTAHGGTHVGANLVGTGPVLIEEAGKYKITARVNLEQVDSECNALALRILDGTGNETFQIYAPLENLGEPGWQEMSWEVDTEHFDTEKTPSWGQQVNGVVDMPARLLGFAIGFRDWKTKGGTILIDDISVTKID
jgi:hypothetical protein